MQIHAPYLNTIIPIKWAINTKAAVLSGTDNEPRLHVPRAAV